MTFVVLALGLLVGVLVGLLGIGGGVVLVPAMVYLLHYDQHLAQGTSLFILLPPLGLGALLQYWKNKQVDLRAGIYCTVGFFLILSAVLLWRKTRGTSTPESEASNVTSENHLRSLGIFLVAAFCGVAA